MKMSCSPMPGFSFPCPSAPHRSLHAYAPSPVGKSSLLQERACVWKKITKARRMAGTSSTTQPSHFWISLGFYFFQQYTSARSTGYLCAPGLRALVQFSSLLFRRQLERGCCFWGTPFSPSFSLCQDAE